jgi:hypothetical protein
MAVELTPKRIEIMKEAIPGLAKIALIVNMSCALRAMATGVSG